MYSPFALTEGFLLKIAEPIKLPTFGGYDDGGRQNTIATPDGQYGYGYEAADLMSAYTPPDVRAGAISYPTARSGDTIDTNSRRNGGFGRNCGNSGTP